MKRGWITLAIILAVIAFSILIMTRSANGISSETAKCIGENSIIYVQLGCHACKIQEEMFGENYKYLSVIDCWFERETCAKEQITHTPTWSINGEKYNGVQSIEKLKELARC